MSKYPNLIVLLIAVAALIVPLVIIYIPILEHTGGIIAYPLDDAYIHIAIAKNILINHVWGISGHEFSSSSSSIIYPILLAAIFSITGVQVGVPLFLNVIVGIVFLIVLQRWFARQQLTPLQQLIALLVCIFLIPLPPLVQVGMEHTLQLLFYFLFVFSFAEALEHRDNPFRWKIYVYGAIFTAIRYEGMAVIVIACCMLLFYRKLMPALLLGTISFLPVVIFGLYARSKGSDFFPNSVLVKSALSSFSFEDVYHYVTETLPNWMFKSVQYNGIAVQRLPVLLPLLYLLFQKHTAQRPAYRYILIILMIASFLHVGLIMRAGTPRYEAAIMGCSVIIGITLIIRYTNWSSKKSLSGSEWVKIGVTCIMVGPLFLRGWEAFDRSSLAAISIYDQQVQMGQFVHRYYDQDPVALNDIGAVSYFSHGYNLDLWGLGDVAIARSRRKRKDTPDLLDSLSRRRQVKVAIVFQQAFPVLLQRWKKIASWTIPYNNASYDNSVFFYAVDTADAPRLANSLKQFQPSLPSGVRVRYY